MRCILFFIIVASIVVRYTAARSSSSESSPCPTPRLKNGKIRARAHGRIIRYNCFSDFFLVGNKYSICVRGSWDTPIPLCVSPRCPAMAVPKHAVVGKKYEGAILMYFCEPGHVLVGNAEIYCDGRQWNGTAPYCRDSNAVAPTSCDFEKEGLCWWEQDPKHDFDWIRHRFDTPSSHIGTGPTHDHTLGSGYDGYYLYIEASGRLVNDTARIVSPLYSSNLTESGCFSFWYHMYGATMGTLNIYFKPESEVKTSTLMWTKHGNQGNQWLHGLFNLPTVNTSFQIIIEGVRGFSYVSDIAIDDVAILQGDECVVKNVTTAVPPSDGDEVEVYNAMQSCQNRCVTTLTEVTISPEVYSNPEVCQCTIDCAEYSNCCPDFAEYCVYEQDSGDPNDGSTTLSRSTESQTQKLTTTSSSTTTEEIVVFSTGGDSTVGSKVETIPTRPSTLTPTTIRKPTTSRIIIKSTSIPIITRESIPNTTIKTTTIFQKEPRANRSWEITLSNDFVENQTVSESHVLIQDARQLERPAALGLPGIIGIVIGTLAAVTITTIIALFILRKRNKRSSNGSAFADDSDVRFLTSDEVLDFNLAKPAGEDYEL